MTIDNSWQSNYLEVAKWRIKENRGSDRELPEYAHEDRGSSIQELPSSGSSRIILPNKKGIAVIWTWGPFVNFFLSWIYCS